MSSRIAVVVPLLVLGCGLAVDLPLKNGSALLPGGACQQLYPGCGDDPLPAAGCYVVCASDSDCKTGEGCYTRSHDPCAGSQCEACGGLVNVCLPRASCDELQPGCGDNPLPAAGCYTRCTADSDCGAGLRCRERSYNPCAGDGITCDACGAQASFCVSES